jgi:hypothetical protein
MSCDGTSSEETEVDIEVKPIPKSTETPAQPQTSVGEIVELSSDNIQKIRRLRTLRNNQGVPLILSTYIPLGFQLTNFETFIEYSKDDNGYDYGRYETTYKGSNSCKISIIGANGQWGDGPTTTQRIVDTRLFGKLTLESRTNEFTSTTALSAEVIPNPEVDRSVIKGFPQFPKAGYVFDFQCPYQLFNVQEASQILQSLEIFNP